jgi:hypothetical protein
MQRSSQSIANLVAALAKAQVELVNPEKSLVATIRSDGPRGVEQTFRYAPLSSGLDIVRKTLGQHEIATVQTTAIDQTAGFVNLTTVLAHASGEWIASDWPICAVSDTATPHRMGAALTYARRYALFTLVGIAGEDDLDAPDLNAPTSSSSTENQAPTRDGLNGHSPQQFRRDRGAKTVSGHPEQILGPEPSAALRDQLATELAEINSAEEATTWAHRVLGTKNSLTAADAAQRRDSGNASMLLSITLHRRWFLRCARRHARARSVSCGIAGLSALSIAKIASFVRKASSICARQQRAGPGRAVQCRVADTMY